MHFLEKFFRGQNRTDTNSSGFSPSYNVVRLQDVGEEVVKIQNAMGSSVDLSFDCVGFSKTMSVALNATRAGGKVCLVGLGQSEMTLPLTPAAARYYTQCNIFGLLRHS